MKEYTTIEEIAAYLDTIPDWIWDVFSDELPQAGSTEDREKGQKYVVAKRLYDDRGTPQAGKALEEKMERLILGFLGGAVKTQILFTALEQEGYAWPFDRGIEAKESLKSFRAYDAIEEKAWHLWEDMDPDGAERQHLDGFFAGLARLIVRSSTYQDFADAVSFTFSVEIGALRGMLRTAEEGGHV